MLELEPNFAEALLCLCQCHEALGQHQEAIDTLSRVAEVKPEMAGWCEREANRLADAGGAGGGAGEVGYTPEKPP